MFFKNIANYSKSTMRILTLIAHIVYVGLLVVGPTIIIASRYKLFEKASVGLKITGVGFIFFVILGLYGYIKIKQTVDKLPQIKLSQQRVKFTLQTIISLMPLGLIVVASVLVRDDINRAFNTMLMCVGFFIGSILWDGLILKYVIAENELRSEALKNKEVRKREDLV